MKLNKFYTALTLVALFTGGKVSAQLFIDNAQFFIQAGATVTVQGDVTSNTDIQGTGLLQMKGTALQNLNMNGFNIPNLEIDNNTNVLLTGNCKVGSSLLFTNGKVQLGNFNFVLDAATTVTGAADNKFLETNGSGQLQKLLTANVSNYEMPIGIGSNYRPAFVTSSGTYSNANVGVRVINSVDPSKPPMISDYIAAHWPVTQTGITGSLNVAGQYKDADLMGTETNLRGYYFNGTDWSSVGETHDAASNRISAPVIGASGKVYGMDKFVLTKAKVFLQGAYNSVTGVMSDALRTPSNLIPLTDPYRSAPYNFSQIANPVAEVAAANVLNDQASSDDNIVDWVFLELRTNGVNPGNTVLQTRSAFVKRDGNIVDIDGVSPVTFNNTANGNYTIAIRHRNHLGISADPVVNLLPLGEQKSSATLLDMTTASDAQIFGTADAYTTSGGKNILWGGNANSNANVRYTGIQNDKDIILADLAGASSLTGYYRSDLNNNRTLRYTGISNDKDFLLATILASITSTTRTQQLPQ